MLSNEITKIKSQQHICAAQQHTHAHTKPESAHTTCTRKKNLGETRPPYPGRDWRFTITSWVHIHTLGRLHVVQFRSVQYISTEKDVREREREKLDVKR